MVLKEEGNKFSGSSLNYLEKSFGGEGELKMDGGNCQTIGWM